MAEKNSTANAVEANNTARKALIIKLTLLIPVHPSFEDALGFGVEVIISVGSVLSIRGLVVVVGYSVADSK
jgi:hypothetical protein